MSRDVRACDVKTDAPLDYPNTRKHALGLVESPDHVCCRYRIRQFLPRLHDYGWGLDFRSSPWGLQYFSNSWRADAVILQRRLLDSFQLSILRMAAQRLVFDFDDAVLYRDSYAAKGPTSHRRTARFSRTVQAADAVLAGNGFLAELAQQFTEPEKVHVLPTCVDPLKYQPKTDVREKKTTDLVWVGSSSTMRGLERIGPTLDLIGTTLPWVRLKIICDCFPKLYKLNTVHVRWSEATEAEQITSADIGISWVPDDLWSRGKCGLKLLQYMASGLPVIANPVGVQSEMVEHGLSGFLVRSAAEWIEAIQTLAADPQLRFEMGQRGRQIVEEQYTVARWAPIFQSTLDGSPVTAPTLDLAG